MRRLVDLAPCRPARRCCGCRRRRPRPARSGGSRRTRPGCRDAGSRVKATPEPESVAAVAEDHRLHVDRGAEVLGDPLLAAVEHARGRCSTSRRPRASRGRAARAGPAGSRGRRARAMACLKVSTSPRRSSTSRSRSDSVPRSFFSRVERLGEHLGVDAEHGGAEHLEQPAVGVQREPLVARSARPGRATDSSLRPTLRTVSIIPGIENFAPGADADQQRVVGVAEPACPSPPRARAGARRSRRRARRAGRRPPR